MAWRLEAHVVRGEIDNRVRGRVTGRIWLAGVTEPLVLELEGDCEPDLAGCQLRFENPRPVPMTTAPPHLQQRGQTGVLTTARKVRVFDLPTEESSLHLPSGGQPPEHLANALHLAWSSRRSGAVIIESAHYHLEISEPAWRFTAEEIRQRGALPEAETESDEEWDEFRSEQFLRESDARTERYGQLLKKYQDHPDAERIIAQEMGWTWREKSVRPRERGLRGERRQEGGRGGRGRDGSAG